MDVVAGKSRTIDTKLPDWEIRVSFMFLLQAMRLEAKRAASNPICHKLDDHSIASGYKKNERHWKTDSHLDRLGNYFMPNTFLWHAGAGVLRSGRCIRVATVHGCIETRTNMYDRRLFVS